MAEEVEKEDGIAPRLQTTPTQMDLGRIDHPFPPAMVLCHPSTRRLAEEIVIKTNSNGESKSKVGRRPSTCVAHLVHNFLVLYLYGKVMQTVILILYIYLALRVHSYV